MSKISNELPSSAALAFLQKLDEEVVEVVQGGVLVVDTRASAAANWDEAGNAMSAVPEMWGKIINGEAVMGGGSPAKRVQRAEGFDKVKVALTEHGGNVGMGVFLSIMGTAAAITDTVHAAAYAASSVFDR